MTSRALILASVLLFVNGCDYSQKKPQVEPGAIVTAAAAVVGSPQPAFSNEPVFRTRVSGVIPAHRT
jgi:hypothetical protein